MHSFSFSPLLIKFPAFYCERQTTKSLFLSEILKPHKLKLILHQLLHQFLQCIVVYSHY